jgi:hypothetical protein
LHFVLLRFFLFSRSQKKGILGVGMPLLILFFIIFFLYLFLKCTLEDADEASGGGDGAPLSLILTIVSIY